jgi:hypothetical protein
MSDKITYKIIISGIAQKNKVANITTASVKKIHRISFPFHPNFLNLSANNGISDTINNEKIRELMAKK